MSDIHPQEARNTRLGAAGALTDTLASHSSATVLPSAMIVICTRDRPAQLERCLVSLAQSELRPDEILIVDNSPRTAPASACAERWGVHYVLETEPGLSYARNRGARFGKSDVIVYVDDDVIVERGWLRALLQEFEDPKVAVACGCCFPMEDQGTDSVRQSMREWWGADRERLVLDQSNPRWAEIAISGAVGLGLNMAFLRKELIAAGGFDERLGRGVPIDTFEEHAAYLALLERGCRTVYSPLAVVRHPVPESMTAFRKFRLRSRASFVGSILLLLAEQPAMRPPIGRLVSSWYTRARRSQPTQGRVSAGSWGETVVAIATGTALFLQTALQSRGRPRRGVEGLGDVSGPLPDPTKT